MMACRVYAGPPARKGRGDNAAGSLERGLSEDEPVCVLHDQRAGHRLDLGLAGQRGRGPPGVVITMPGIARAAFAGELREEVVNRLRQRRWRDPMRESRGTSH
jgi:hypothetical protein